MIGPAPVVLIASVLIGATVGSFASTAVTRSSQGEPALRGRSRCDECRTPLGFAATVPVVSWVQRRGVCSTCGGPIPVLHPIGEIAGAAIGLAVAVIARSPEQTVLLAVLGVALLAASLVDLETLKLPDLWTGVAAICGAGLSYLQSLDSLLTGVAAAAVAFTLLEAIRRTFLALRRKPGLGFGDVKLVAALALWLGLATSWAVALAAALGLVAFLALRPAGGRLPFGPWLALSAGVVGLVREAGLWPMFV
jgi:leader peptidase (prepilin peptidase)/N-methyltransferase